MRKIQQIKIAECYTSPTNPRGKVVEDDEFKDLVASIRERGVIVPVIARRGSGARFEIVAGNRRLAAAKAAGLKEIPADVQELNDEEARAVQIIENLQRAGVHPIEEGEAYRKLMERGKLDLKSVALKVGKSEKYVATRLALTNLTSKAAAAFRDGKIMPSIIAMIARLDEKLQNEAVKFALDRDADMDDMREWIQESTFAQLRKDPPWKDETALKAAIAPCPECTKVSGKTLFGEREEKQCADPKCYARKLTAYIELKKLEFAAKKIPLTLVSSSYSAKGSGVKGSQEYQAVSKDKPCQSQHAALIVEGYDNVGKSINICTNHQCKIHYRHSSGPTAAERKEAKERRAKDKAAEAKREAAEAKILFDIAQAVKWPLQPAAVHALLLLAIEECGYGGPERICKRLGIEPLKAKYGGQDYEKPLVAYAEKAEPAEQIRLVFEVLISSYNKETNKKVSTLLGIKK